LEDRLRDYAAEFPGSGSAARATPRCILSEVQINARLGQQELPTFSDATDAAIAARMKAAVNNWMEESNGKCEARVFKASHPLTEQHLGNEALLSLGLECLQDVRPESLQTVQLTPRQVINALFAAAANGGAYNWGLGGAYGRLAAWRSVAGMAGALETDSIENLAVSANRCLWHWFEAASSWFYGIIDMGLIAVRPDRMSFAVLAATDTD
jgi:hypothetical protein